MKLNEYIETHIKEKRIEARREIIRVDDDLEQKELIKEFAVSIKNNSPLKGHTYLKGKELLPTIKEAIKMYMTNNNRTDIQADTTVSAITKNHAITLPESQWMPQFKQFEAKAKEKLNDMIKALAIADEASIGAGIDTLHDNSAYYTFDGDLNQMAIIYEALKHARFPVTRSGVSPAFTKSKKYQYIKALKFLWNEKIEGWWNQRDAMIEHSICTIEQFTTILKNQTDNKK